jgi:hypothetical protein
LRESLGRKKLDAAENASPWQTCCLEFEKSQGWRRPQAEDWIAKHLGLRDLGRSTRLTALHRMKPGLAAFLSDTVFANGSPGGDMDQLEISEAAVEFVAVPLALPGQGRNAPTARDPKAQLAAWEKGGAGLELELSDPRQRERLPADVRNGLPGKGIVNYPEAQAVVRCLLRLAEENGEQRNESPTPPLRVAVIALYPGQVELIRRLIGEKLEISSQRLSIEIGLPELFRHREVDIVILSLTRSQTHRAVCFGDGPRSLELALTRARSRLILVGDSGTLFRREHWQGRVELLDETLAGRERELIGHLVRYLQGKGRHAQAFRIESGSK